MKYYYVTISTRKMDIKSARNTTLYWYSYPLFNYFRSPNFKVLKILLRSKKPLDIFLWNAADEIIWDY